MLFQLPMFIFRNFLLPYFILSLIVYGIYASLSDQKKSHLKKEALVYVEKFHYYLKSELEKDVR